MSTLTKYYLRFRITKFTCCILPEQKIFHISEEGAIKIFYPRPSPSHFVSITGDVIFGISEQLLHNYLLPRDCLRICYYAKADTKKADKLRLLRSETEYVIAIEATWLPVIRRTTLYCYEFDANDFELLDEGSGYYISYQPVVPVKHSIYKNLLETLYAKPNLELFVLPVLTDLTEAVKLSTLQYSLIRMSNAAR
jgi:hypothetical protein